MANPSPSQRYDQQAPTVAADNTRLTTPSGTVLLARFSQVPETHDSLAGHLLTDASKDMIIQLLTIGGCSTYVGMPGITPPQTYAQLERLNIRFASFYIKIKTPSDSPRTPIISAYMIPTIPVHGFAVINLLALAASTDPAANQIYNNCVVPGGVLTVLFRKILYELKVLGYNLTGTELDYPKRPARLLINCDIYYNRSNVQGGHFHRDIAAITHDVNLASVATAAAFGLDPDYVANVVEFGNIPQNVSLEFFSPEIPSPVFLGPEVFLRDIAAGENPTVRYSDADVRTEFLDRRIIAVQAAATAPVQIAQAQAVAAAAHPFDIHAQAAPGQILAAAAEVAARARSLRVLVTNGTTVLFNNFTAIHATPITQPYQVLQTDLTPFHGLGNPFEDDENRLENENPHHPAVAITRDNPRTFLRTWIAAAPEWFIIKDYPNLPIKGFQALAEIAGLPAVYFLELNPSQIFGGSIRDPQNKVKINNFKILGDPKNPIVKINCDVPFEEIKGPENIEKYKLKELEFINKLISKKGGKNNRRKYKKTYNRKTKKSTKTKKAKKHHKNTKSKRSKMSRN